jgi:FxsC-like protein
MRLFFLSYDPGDDDLYVRRFFLDLSTAVRDEATDAERDVGVLDVGDNDRWPHDVRQELATCQTLVVLWSPKLLLNDRCGRVWTVFADRLRQYKRATGLLPPALIPVVWSSSGPAVDHGLDDDLDLIAAPSTMDVRVLIRLHSHRQAYRDFVKSLARRVVDTAHRHRIPAAPPGVDLGTATNAFDRWSGWRDSERAPQPVHLVVAAGTREQMRIVREDVGYSGERQEDWAPYQPAVPQPLANRARVVAAERLLEPQVASIDALNERIARARERNEIVVVLVDAWVTQLAEFRQALSRFDEADAPTVVVLVPASRDDPETCHHQGELRAGVLATLPRAAERREPMFRTEIETAGRFDDDLAAALEEAQNRIFGKGRVFRPPMDGPATARPILEGP